MAANALPRRSRIGIKGWSTCAAAPDEPPSTSDGQGKRANEANRHHPGPGVTEVGDADHQAEHAEAE